MDRTNEHITDNIYHAIAVNNKQKRRSDKQIEKHISTNAIVL